MNKYLLLVVVSVILVATLSMEHIERFATDIFSQNVELQLAQSRSEQLEIKLTKSRKNKERQEKMAYLLGRFDPAEHSSFALVPSEYAVVGGDIYLRRETMDAYLKMRNAASRDGVDLRIASATRNFDYQKSIWERKWNSYATTDGIERFDKILEYSAAPGTSRHHWGTEIDINDANPEYFNSDKGAREYEWLELNAGRFGFCQTYTQKSVGRVTGYNEEKWHWSYLPLSRGFTEDYRRHIKAEDISGFLGEEYAIDQNLINKYVLGINPECI